MYISSKIKYCSFLQSHLDKEKKVVIVNKIKGGVIAAPFRLVEDTCISEGADEDIIFIPDPVSRSWGTYTPDYLPPPITPQEKNIYATFLESYILELSESDQDFYIPDDDLLKDVLRESSLFNRAFEGTLEDEKPEVIIDLILQEFERSHPGDYVDSLNYDIPWESLISFLIKIGPCLKTLHQDIRKLKEDLV